MNSGRRLYGGGRCGPWDVESYDAVVMLMCFQGASVINLDVGF